jgi:predicted Zn-dependent protease
MPLPTEAEARDVIMRVLARSQADACRVFVGGSDTGNVRFARNAVSTSGTTANLSLFVQSSFGAKSGSATGNAFDDATLDRVVSAAEALARLAPDDPEYVPPLGPQTYQPSVAWAGATAAIDGAQRAGAARQGIDAAREAGCVAAGFLEHSASANATGNSAGLFAYNRQTQANYTVTMRTPDGRGSGFGTTDSFDVGRMDVVAASRTAARKAVASREARAIEPGKYTVILEPAASVDLLQYLLFDMGARSADEGRSSLARPGGTRLGEKLLDERVTITSDPLDPLAPTATWDGEGRPLGPTTWIDRGVVRQFYYSRYWAARQKQPATPFPANFLMGGGTKSVDELVAETARGILVTRTWYIRGVDPQTLLFTGLTRDGTFYIEDGKILHAVKNMRFNESPIVMLNNVDELGRPMRVSNAETGLPSVVPPMRIRDFTFSSMSDAV